jgi:hypothetical protein
MTLCAAIVLAPPLIGKQPEAADGTDKCPGIGMENALAPKGKKAAFLPEPSPTEGRKRRQGWRRQRA